jgi:hypothetical protein
MGKDKSKQHPKSASPDDLAKTKKKGNVELTEQELRKASGGLKYELKDVVITSVNVAGHK